MVTLWYSTAMVVYSDGCIQLWPSSYHYSLQSGAFSSYCQVGYMREGEGEGRTRGGEREERGKREEGGPRSVMPLLCRQSNVWPQHQYEREWQ